MKTKFKISYLRVGSLFTIFEVTHTLCESQTLNLLVTSSCKFQTRNSKFLHLRAFNETSPRNICVDIFKIFTKKFRNNDELAEIILLPVSFSRHFILRLPLSGNLLRKFHFYPVGSSVIKLTFIL